MVNRHTNTNTVVNTGDRYPCIKQCKSSMATILTVFSEIFQGTLPSFLRAHKGGWARARTPVSTGEGFRPTEEGVCAGWHSPSSLSPNGEQ